MREPRFWSADIDPRSREAAPLFRVLLTPVSWLYAYLTNRRIKKTTPTVVSATVICVGNLTVGGVGKSPVVQEFRERLSNGGLRVATLSRGYKGRLRGPVKVDPTLHTAADVGDEPLMLACTGESWIGAKRDIAAKKMVDAGVDVIIMDDGHQNPDLAKDLSFVVIDGKYRFGNGHVLPKGPLREHPKQGLSRADAVIVFGSHAGLDLPSQLPVFTAKITPKDKPPTGRLVAFAGIGKPEKFFDTLRELEADLVDTAPFPDHHAYSQDDLSYLSSLAADHEAKLITTEKDYVRLPVEFREQIAVLRVTVEIDSAADLDKLLALALKQKQI